MSRLRYGDILVEMIELCHERMTEVRQQLVYYRASVYKGETLAHMAERVEQLRVVAGLFGDAMLDAFVDFDAMSKVGAMQLAPGECSFSTRVTCLLQNLDASLTRIGRELQAREAAPTNDPTGEAGLAEAVRKNRDALLAICRQGTRTYTFFQNV